MSLYTTESLIDAFAVEMSWRRRELTELKRLVESAGESPVSRAALIRSAVALLYAHWEGIVRRLSEYYLQFVNMQRLKNCELSDCMLAIVIKSKFHDLESTHKVRPHQELLQFMRSCMDDRSRVPHAKIIQTESNLSSVVFAEILTTLGISSAPYEAKFHLIDHSLLAKRNHIAHGQLLNVDIEEYLLLHEEVTDLFSIYRNDLENAAVTRQFKRASNINQS